MIAAVQARGVTQRITQTDIDHGRIRIPSAGSTKGLLPRERTEIEVVLKGRELGRVRYDPRLGPDRQRSGVISIPRAILASAVKVDERLPVVTGKRGVVYIGDRGSKLRIAQWVNDSPEKLADRLKKRSTTLSDFLGPREPVWLSPLRKNDYVEFADDLWTRARLPRPDPISAGFWPRGGPNWDATATLEGPYARAGVLLVEAKSHVAEVRSTCGATSAASRTKITRSLRATRRYLGVEEDRDWLDGYYQAANRLAFLYFLRARLGVPAWLVSVYFIGDEFEVGGVQQACPKDQAGWNKAITEMHAWLGLPASDPLSHFRFDLFLPAESAMR